MMRVDRAHYAPTSSSPYEDSPQRIGFHATISAPHMHAKAAEALLDFLRPGNSVLDVGSGSGYLTHVLGELVRDDDAKEQGKVVGVEHIQALVDLSRENTGKSAEGSELMEKGILQYVRGDGRLGWEAEAPYDAIHVGAAAAGHQQRLIDQLKCPGRLFIPVEEEGLQHVYVVDKDAEGRVTKKKEYGVRYVPLADAPVE